MDTYCIRRYTIEPSMALSFDELVHAFILWIFLQNKA
jgi:hypothetical protein